MAFAAFMQNRSEALVVGADPFFIERRVQLVTLATRYLLPAIYQLRSFVEVGGLVSYGASDFVRYREVGIYTGRILKGEKPGDMPVVQPTKFGHQPANGESNRDCRATKPARAGRRGD